jgi:hypothetical protein
LESQTEGLSNNDISAAVLTWIVNRTKRKMMEGFGLFAIAFLILVWALVACSRKKTRMEMKLKEYEKGKQN